MSKTKTVLVSNGIFDNVTVYVLSFLGLKSIELYFYMTVDVIH